MLPDSVGNQHAQNPKIVVLGASGLIGAALAEALMAQGFAVAPIARRFSPSQASIFGVRAVTAPVVDLTEQALADLLRGTQADIIVNCIGILQNGPKGRSDDVHEAFIARLLAAQRALATPTLLVHLSVPGREDEDRTAFSQTKRRGEWLIREAGLPHVIIRPGFVIAPAAFGGSALIRALAALPFDLPPREASRPFAATAASDIVRSLVFLARQWQKGNRNWQAQWDVMERASTNVGEVIEAFRARFGEPSSPWPIKARWQMPAILMTIGARLADWISLLGWSPPIRTTALMEMRRGVAGDPAPWQAATGLTPLSLHEALNEVPSTVQERWFARLYLLKAAIIADLAAFWLVSGALALTLGFDAARQILLDHGFPRAFASSLTLFTSLADIAVAAAIAMRPYTRTGLDAGIALSLIYLASACLFTPTLWFDPLGPLVKVVPAILLMVVAKAILDER